MYIWDRGQRGRRGFPPIALTPRSVRKRNGGNVGGRRIRCAPSAEPPRHPHVSCAADCGSPRRLAGCDGRQRFPPFRFRTERRGPGQSGKPAAPSLGPDPRIYYIYHILIISSGIFAKRLVIFAFNACCGDAHRNVTSPDQQPSGATWRRSGGGAHFLAPKPKKSNDLETKFPPRGLQPRTAAVPIQYTRRCVVKATLWAKSDGALNAAKDSPRGELCLALA